MGLWNSLRSAVLGVDLEEVQRTSDATDAALAVENQKDYAPGGTVYETIKEERGEAAADQAYEIVQDHEATQHIEVEEEVDEAFQEGFQEGADNIRGAIAAPFKIGWSILPWQLITVALVAGALYLFFFMGGNVFLKGFIARRFK